MSIHEQWQWKNVEDADAATATATATADDEDDSRVFDRTRDDAMTILRAIRRFFEELGREVERAIDSSPLGVPEQSWSNLVDHEESAADSSSESVDAAPVYVGKSGEEESFEGDMLRSSIKNNVDLWIVGGMGWLAGKMAVIFHEEEENAKSVNNDAQGGGEEENEDGYVDLKSKNKTYTKQSIQIFLHNLRKSTMLVLEKTLANATHVVATATNTVKSREKDEFIVTSDDSDIEIDSAEDEPYTMLAAEIDSLASDDEDEEFEDDDCEERHSIVKLLTGLVDVGEVVILKTIGASSTEQGDEEQGDEVMVIVKGREKPQLDLLAELPQTNAKNAVLNEEDYDVVAADEGDEDFVMDMDM